MKRKFIKIKRICLAFTGILLMAFLLTSQAVLASGKIGTLTVYYHGVTPEEIPVVLSDADFSLYKVGIKSGDEWKLQGDFEKSSVSLEDMSSSGQRVAAEQLYNFAGKQNIQAQIKKTDSNGRAVFYNLEEGLYLCSAIQDISVGGGVFRSAPFLVFMPEMDENGEDIYNVEVEPKNEWVNKEDEKNPSFPSTDGTGQNTQQESDVKTGDVTSLEDIIKIFGVSAAILFSILIWKNRKNRNLSDMN